MEINIDLDSDHLKIELSKEAKSRGISLEKLVEEILKEYVQNEELKVV